MPPTKAHSPESDAAKCHFVSSSYPNETPLALPLLSASSSALSDTATTTTGVKPVSPLLAAADHAFKGETNVAAHDKVDPEKLSLLVEMGFSRADVAQALNESDGDVNSAVLRLTSNQQWPLTEMNEQTNEQSECTERWRRETVRHKICLHLKKINNQT